jgi:hypothetical protein
VRWKVHSEDWRKGGKDARVVREGEELLDDEPELDPSISAPRWTYIGIDMDDQAPSADALLQAAQMGELQSGYGPFVTDLYGCHGALLRKRRRRNPYKRVHAYHMSAPEIAGLLEWCPGGVKVGGGDEEGAAPIRDVYTKVYEGKLPWDDLWDD